MESSAKRKRTDSVSSTVAMEEAAKSAPAVNRSSQLWFNDGNIVLQVENTLFRVHSSVLARHSEIFKDMVGIPQPAQPEEPLVEGCPVVILTDTAEDVEHLLLLLYDSIKAYNRTKPIPLASLTAMLRLGKKYEIRSFREEGMARLRAMYPTDLSLWDPNMEGIVNENNHDIEHAVINLAHELSLTTVLPTMYLRFFQKYIHRALAEPNPRLNRRALTQMSYGRESFTIFLYERHRELCMKMLKDTGPLFEGCTDSRKCRPIGLQTFDNFKLWTSEATSEPVLSSLPRFTPPLVRPCPSCLKHLQNMYDTTRLETWQKLPTFFKLPKWEDMKDEMD